MLLLLPSECAIIECLLSAARNGKTITQPDKIVTGVRQHYLTETLICLWIISNVCLFNSGIISTFLHVHPFGANIEYLWSYMQQLDSKVNYFARVNFRCSNLACWLLPAGGLCMNWTRAVAACGGWSALLFCKDLSFWQIVLLFLLAFVFVKRRAVIQNDNDFLIWKAYERFKNIGSPESSQNKGEIKWVWLIGHYPQTIFLYDSMFWTSHNRGKIIPNNIKIWYDSRKLY